MKTVWMVALALAGACTGDGTTDTDTDTPVDTDTDLPAPTTGTSDERILGIVDLDGDVAAGATFYVANCQLCHCTDGTGASCSGGGADLTGTLLDEAGIVTTVLRGLPYTNMDAYDDYRNQQLADVTAYVMDAFTP